MSNFKELLNDVLNEKQKSYKDLEKDGIISKRSFYQYKTFTPFLPTIIKIANELQISLDYLAERTNINSFRKYKEDQSNFYNNLMKVLKDSKVSQSKIAECVKIGRPNFSYWKKGSLPKFNTLIDLADYLQCSIDDFLDRY